MARSPHYEGRAPIEQRADHAHRDDASRTRVLVAGHVRDLESQRPEGALRDHLVPVPFDPGVRDDNELGAVEADPREAHRCGDVHAFREADHSHARRTAELFLAMRRHPRPIVAAVRGRALAGGCGLATAADIILAAESAEFGYPEVNIGFIPAMVMAILRRSISEKRAFELITMGEVIQARAAYEMGLVHRVFADDPFDEEVSAYVEKLASKSTSAVGLAKQLLYHMDAMSFEAALEAGVQANAIARLTEDCRRGVERFLKKHP